MIKLTEILKLPYYQPIIQLVDKLRDKYANKDGYKSESAWKELIQNILYQKYHLQPLHLKKELFLLSDEEMKQLYADLKEFEQRFFPPNE